MRVCIFEDAGAERLEPLALTRPTFELRCGARTLREWQSNQFAGAAFGFVVRPHLADLARLLHPNCPINDLDWLQAADTLWVNSRWLPDSSPSADAPHGFIDDDLAFFRTAPGQLNMRLVELCAEWVHQQAQRLPKTPCNGVMIRYLWDLVEHNSTMIQREFGEQPAAAPTNDAKVAVVGDAARLIIHSTATVEPIVVADTTRGPVVIDREAVVQAFSRLEGPCYIGPGSWVVSARIRSSTIGPMCRIGGEVEASIIQGYSNKYHEGFLGHSYVGEWVNLAAGTQVSDLRNDYGHVTVTVNGERVHSRQSKIGSFIGDHTKTGLNSLFNTGTVIGPFCNLLPAGELMPRAIPAFCRYSRGRIETRSDWGDLLATAARVMNRRGQIFTDVHAQVANAVFERTRIRRLALRT